jgi:sugar phosphate isomerase/epimerase
MMTQSNFSRRTFLAAAASSPLLAAAKAKNVPVGLELFSVRDELAKDLMGTVKAVAKMGYAGVEFFSPYMQWTSAQTKDVRTLLDDLNIKCFSTHNGADSFSPEKMGKALELNQILGSKFIVMASSGKVEGLDGWKTVAEKLDAGAEKFKSAGIRAGYHNHQTEFKEVNGKRPIEIIAANTSKNVMLQLDLGTCVEVGYNPVEWINKNPGRINSMHLKEWSPETGYKALFGEGKVPWKAVFDAAEKVGGVEYYLIEQEGSRFTPFESAEKCLAAYKKLRA